MQKQLSKNTIIVLLVISVISIFGDIFISDYMKQNHVVSVKSYLFNHDTPVNLQDIVENKNPYDIFQKGDNIDSQFKIALFYSDLSIAVLLKSRKESEFEQYVPVLYHKSLEKWDDLITQDRSMRFFKDYYIQVYQKNLSN